MKITKPNSWGLTKLLTSRTARGSSACSSTRRIKDWSSCRSNWTSRVSITQPFTVLMAGMKVTRCHLLTSADYKPRETVCSGATLADLAARVPRRALSLEPPHRRCKAQSKYQQQSQTQTFVIACSSARARWTSPTSRGTMCSRPTWTPCSTGVSSSTPPRNSAEQALVIYLHNTPTTSGNEALSESASGK